MRRSLILASLGTVYLAPRGFKRAFAPPQPPVDQTPSDLGLPEQVVSLEGPSGKRLHGWFVPVDGQAPGIVVVHGWGSNSSLMLPLAAHLHDAGFHALFLDVRNHGLSEHDDFVSMPRFAEDLDVAVDWLLAQPRVSSAGVIGHSVGGAAAILSASRNAQLGAVVAVSAFADPRDMMQQQLSRAPKPIVGLILAAVQRTIGYKFEEFAPRNRIALIQAPVLLVHGDQDDVVPLENLHRLVAAKPSAEVLVVPGGGHRDLAPIIERVHTPEGFRLRSSLRGEQMLKDRYGLELSTASEEARDAYVDAADKMLAANGAVEERLAIAIEADPSFALPHAALARQHQLCARGKDARASAETASELAGDATIRERQHVEIISQMVIGQVPKALELTHKHVAEFPRDALALAPACGVFGSIGFNGHVGREAEQLALLEPLATEYGDDWWFQTVYAFALIETGQWDRGRDLAERSLDQFRANPHGAHTLAHALYEAGADDEAAGFLEAWLPQLDPESLMYCHIWWHYALAFMTKGDLAKAQEAFVTNCLPGTSTSPSINVLTDSASFLWRSELAGAPRDEALWEIIREYATGEFRRPIVFVDAHVGLAYAALGQTEEMQACINELQELGESGRLPAETTAATLTRAYDAFGSEDWGRAIEILEPMMSEVVRIGGSRAQRDLITNTLLAAYVNDGRHDDAANFLQGIDGRQPSHPVLGLN